MPRELNLVPARLQDSREISVMDEGIPDPVVLIGAEDVGIVMVSAKPRIADVNMPDASSASFSLGASLGRTRLRRRTSKQAGKLGR